jgi:hypothetical protein
MTNTPLLRTSSAFIQRTSTVLSLCSLQEILVIRPIGSRSDRACSLWERLIESAI